jgi:hypothetical protein
MIGFLSLSCFYIFFIFLYSLDIYMELLGTGNSDYELIIKLEEHFIALNNYYNNETRVPKGTRNDQVCCTIEDDILLSATHIL